MSTDISSYACFSAPLLSLSDVEDSDPSALHPSAPSHVPPLTATACLPHSSSSTNKKLFPNKVPSLLLVPSTASPSTSTHVTAHIAQAISSSSHPDPTQILSTSGWSVSSSGFAPDSLPTLIFMPNKLHGGETTDSSNTIIIDKSATPRLPELTSLSSTPSCTTPLKNLNSQMVSTNTSSQFNSPLHSPRPPSTPSSASSSTSSFTFSEDLLSVLGSGSVGAASTAPSTATPPQGSGASSSFLKMNRRIKVSEDQSGLSSSTSNTGLNSVLSNSLSNCPSTQSMALSSSSESFHSSYSNSHSCSSSTVTTLKNAVMKHTSSTSMSGTASNSTGMSPRKTATLPDSLNFHSNSHLNVIKIIPGPTPLLVAGSSDSNLYVYSLLDGTKMHMLSGHSDRVISLTFFQDLHGDIDSTKFKSNLAKEDHDAATTAPVTESQSTSGSTTTPSQHLSDSVSSSGLPHISSTCVPPAVQSFTLPDRTSSTHSFSSDDVARTERERKNSNSAASFSSSTSGISPDHVPLISPSITYILSGARDSKIVLWDLSRMKCIHQIPAHSSPIWAVDISLNATTKTFSLVSASAKGTIKVFDGYTGKLKYSLKSHIGPIYSLSSVSISNDVLAYCKSETNPSHPSSLSTASMPLSEVPAGTTAFVYRELLFSAGADRTIHCWDLERGHHIKSFPAHADEIKSLSVSVFRGFRVLKPVLSGEQVDELIDEQGSVIVAAGGKDGSILVWEFHSGSFLFDLQEHQKPITSLKLSYLPASYSLYHAQSTLVSKPLKVGTPIVLSTAEDGQLKIFNLLNYKQLNAVRLGSGSNRSGGRLTAVDMDIFFDTQHQEESIYLASSGADKSVSVCSLIHLLKKGSTACNIC